MIILPQLLEQLWIYKKKKTNRLILTKLFQDLGSCLNWLIHTFSCIFIQLQAALLHNIM